MGWLSRVLTTAGYHRGGYHAEVITWCFSKDWLSGSGYHRSGYHQVVITAGVFPGWLSRNGYHGVVITRWLSPGGHHRSGYNGVVISHLVITGWLLWDVLNNITGWLSRRSYHNVGYHHMEGGYHVVLIERVVVTKKLSTVIRVGYHGVFITGDYHKGSYHRGGCQAVVIIWCLSKEWLSWSGYHVVDIKELL